ncbi:multiple antibiotic resistance (MarC)-related protein [Desulfovibrio sp. X2]|uniref:MarC family protein n=1 Tax=Desulfovibrio sp. X2 TaxID=941449 RepID=UPI000358E4F6|nr:MarC family protein [Desulfovibrio sp. X2]EPR42183.1 multiple antibiotic resistance (MarC)-related protein [Desulfovibrio sp. X2]
MTTPFTLFIETYIKLFFLLTPFFVLSAFLSMTREMDLRARRALALRVMLAVAVAGCVLSLAGNAIFNLFGITLDAFRVGAGALLFLSAVSLVRGTRAEQTPESEGDISVVPLAIPITIGPATVGALLVMGAQLEAPLERAVELGAFVAASISVGVMLLAATAIERLVGRMGLTILSKLTGLILAALSAQIVFTGIRGLLGR